MNLLNYINNMIQAQPEGMLEESHRQRFLEKATEQEIESLQDHKGTL
jgi:hypothetical protein